MKDRIFGLPQASIDIAIVINIDDPEDRPENLSRVQVRIPSMHGPVFKEDLPPDCINSAWMEDEDLPWASLCYPLGSIDADKHDFLEEFEMVYVAYPSGDQRYPLIIGTSGKLVTI